MKSMEMWCTIRFIVKIVLAVGWGLPLGLPLLLNYVDSAYFIIWWCLIRIKYHHKSIQHNGLVHSRYLPTTQSLLMTIITYYYIIYTKSVYYYLCIHKYIEKLCLSLCTSIENHLFIILKRYISSLDDII